MLVGRGAQPTESLRRLVLGRVEKAISATAATADVRFLGGAPLPGVRVDLRSSDPALALLELKPLVLALGQLHDRVNVAYEMRDSGGNVIWLAGATPREGFVWTVPSLDPCQPIPHSMPSTFKPPPSCPARLPARH
jgi:hypothetical protein